MTTAIPATELYVTNLQLGELAGKRWRVDGEEYRFQGIDPSQCGVTPWRIGKEGFAYPLLDASDKVTAYAKFFNRAMASAKRAERSKWLAKQRLYERCDGLRGAPRAWLDTAIVGRPNVVSFDFVCSLSMAVPGRTWTEVKLEAADGRIDVPSELREHWVRDFVRILTTLESDSLVHGDLSPDNLLVTMAISGDAPVLNVIDFDGFVAPYAGEFGRLPIGEQGVFGNEQYCPVDLVERVEKGDLSAAPYSDRRARDLLLIELLCFDENCPPDEPPDQWDQTWLQGRLREQPVAARLPYLSWPNIGTIPESHRPATHELAAFLRIPAPPRRRRSRGPGLQTHLSMRTEIVRSLTSILWVTCGALIAVLGIRLATWIFPINEPLPIGTSHWWGAVAGRVLAAGAFVLAGLYGTTIIGFAQETRSYLAFGDLRLALPARPRWSRRKVVDELLMTGVLGLIAAVLATVTFFSSV